jgi:hypothetical protein
MRWFRSRARLGSYLALFALALQLALSFGHIHRKDILGAPAKSAAIVASTVDQRGAAATPADGATHHHEDGYCAIYAINALLGCAQHLAPPALPLSLALGQALPPAGNEAPLTERHHVLAQARAPPIA